MATVGSYGCVCVSYERGTPVPPSPVTLDRDAVEKGTTKMILMTSVLKMAQVKALTVLSVPSSLDSG